MYFRHASTIWTFADVPAGALRSPVFQHVNPLYDDSDQEFVLLFELSNSEKATGGCYAAVQVGAEDLWLPSAVASDGFDETDGHPIPFTGEGPHKGALLLLPGAHSAPEQLPLRTFSLVPPLMQLIVFVDGGSNNNLTSGRFVLLSNGPIALRELP